MATYMPTIAGSMYQGRIQDGQYTSVVYTLIRNEKYSDAIKILSQQLTVDPRSRPALSLLAYCYYYMQDFHSASQMYEQLCRFHPEVEEYHIYHAQSLYKAGIYESATKVVVAIDSLKYRQRVPPS